MLAGERCDGRWHAGRVKDGHDKARFPVRPTFGIFMPVPRRKTSGEERRGSLMYAAGSKLLFPSTMGLYGRRCQAISLRDIIPRFLIAPSLITCLTLYCGKELKVGLYRNRCCSYGNRIMHRFFRGQGDRDSLYYSSMQIDCNVREHGVNCIHLTKTCNVTISKFGSKFASLS